MAGYPVRTLVLTVATGLMLGGALACGGAGGDNPSAKKSSNARAGETTSTTASPALASNEGQVIVDDHAIIRTGAVGPLRVGEWRRPVLSLVYPIGARVGPDSESVITVRGIGHDTVALTFRNDTLRRITITRIGARTADGIGVGTPFATIANRPDATTAARGKAQIATISGMCGVRFATDSAALGRDSIVKKSTPGTATVRAIVVAPCE